LYELEELARILTELGELYSKADLLHELEELLENPEWEAICRYRWVLELIVAACGG